MEEKAVSILYKTHYDDDLKGKQAQVAHKHKYDGYLAAWERFTFFFMQYTLSLSSLESHNLKEKEYKM